MASVEGDASSQTVVHTRAGDNSALVCQEFAQTLSSSDWLLGVSVRGSHDCSVHVLDTSDPEICRLPTVLEWNTDARYLGGSVFKMKGEATFKLVRCGLMPPSTVP